MRRRTFLRASAGAVGAAAVPCFGLASLGERAAALRVDWGSFTPRQLDLAFAWNPDSGVLSVANRARHARAVTGTVLFSEVGPGRVVVLDEYGEPVPELPGADAGSVAAFLAGRI